MHLCSTVIQIELCLLLSGSVGLGCKWSVNDTDLGLVVLGTSFSLSLRLSLAKWAELIFGVPV